jgi:hypothetical protein
MRRRLRSAAPSPEAKILDRKTGRFDQSSGCADQSSIVYRREHSSLGQLASTVSCESSTGRDRNPIVPWHGWTLGRTSFTTV